MIKKNDTHFFPTYDLCCDDCGARLEGFCSFKEAAAAKAPNGWASRKTGKTWKDLCEDCLRKRAGEEFAR